jgi:hypothetical protein
MNPAKMEQLRHSLKTRFDEIEILSANLERNLAAMPGAVCVDRVGELAPAVRNIQKVIKEAMDDLWRGGRR